jgi:hypothetical protein
VDTKADDIWFWQTTLYTDDALQLYFKLNESGYHFVSRDIVNFKSKNGEASYAFIVKDPDGHAMLIKSTKQNIDSPR